MDACLASDSAAIFVAQRPSGGEFPIVPRGIEHRPSAEEEVQILLFEPASTLKTGNVQSDRAVAHVERI